jgi:hypothetical protein
MPEGVGGERDPLGRSDLTGLDDLGSSAGERTLEPRPERLR